MSFVSSLLMSTYMPLVKKCSRPTKLSTSIYYPLSNWIGALLGTLSSLKSHRDHGLWERQSLRN